MNDIINLAREDILRLLDGEIIAVGDTHIAATGDPKWTPLIRLDLDRLEGIKRAHEVTGQESPIEVWANHIYEVFVYAQEPDAGKRGGLHLSLKRYDRAAVRNWRHLQQIKNEIAGEFREAVELFPGEHRIADNANQYHLWVMPEGMEVPIGWPNGMVVLTPEDVKTYNTNGDAGRQEPMQEGLTIGQGMQAAQEKQTESAGEEARQAILGGALAGRKPNRAERRRYRGRA